MVTTVTSGDLSIQFEKRSKAKFHARRVHFPKGAPYLAELERELLQFPNGKTDDQVDSISQALGHEVSDYTSAMMAAVSG